MGILMEAKKTAKYVTNFVNNAIYLDVQSAQQTELDHTQPNVYVHPTKEEYQEKSLEQLNARPAPLQ